MNKSCHAMLAVLTASAVLLTGASSAQSTSPGANPPPQTAPAPQQVRPQVATPPIISGPATNITDPEIPVAIIGARGGFTGTLTRPADAARPPVTDRDADGDGFTSGVDCDDTRALVRPSGTEVVDADGRDEDCNALTIGDRDLDGDGFVTWRAMQVLRTTSGRAYAVRRGPDCDDTQSDVHPNAPEVVGDQRDNNCDGLIDRIVDTGHRPGEYCGPVQTVRASQAVEPCGVARR